MGCYITHCIAGYIAIDEDENIIDHVFFNETDRNLKLKDIEDKTIIDEEIKLIERLLNKYDSISIESNSRKSNYNKWDNVIVEVPNKAGNFLRENLENILIELEFSDKENIKNKFTKIYEDFAIFKVKELSKSEDKYLIQSINSIDDIDESISKLIERIREWYSLYFPEIDTIHSNEKYIKLIAENKTKKDIVKEYGEELLFNDIEEDIASEDLDILNEFANSIYSLQKTRKNIEKYIDIKMDSIAPNLKSLVGASLGSKLISHAGGLKRLASYSSGTVQIMGAEKALFRHLKTGERPPKHGLIYQHPKVRTSKWWNRGKIARTLALKISLASRKDFYSKEFDKSINEEFLLKVEQIEKDNPFPKRSSSGKAKDKKNSSKKEKKKKSKKRRK